MLDHFASHPQLLPAALLIFAFVTTLLWMGRSLPAQNVISVAVILAALAGIMEIVGAKFGTPFGRFSFTDIAGTRLFGLLPWTVPLMWVVVTLNSRGTARLILRPWRASPNIGLWTLALACALMVLLDAALELYAKANRYWVWQTPKIVPAWQGVPWTNYFGWIITGLLLLTCVMPWLIDKKRLKDPPTDYYPAVIWLVLFLFLAASDAAHHFR